MTPISQTLMDMLTRQGISAGPGATSRAHGMKERAAASDGADSQSRQGEEPVDLNSGKDRGNVTPAKFTGLHVIVDNSRCKPIHTPTRVAPRGIGFHLVLIEGGRK